METGNGQSFQNFIKGFQCGRTILSKKYYKKHSQDKDGVEHMI